MSRLFEPSGSPVAVGSVASRSGQSASERVMPRGRGSEIAFWVITALFCLQMSFTAYAQLRLPQVAAAFTHLGFPGYFRVELSWAKLVGVVLLLAPAPARVKEWVYAGFAIDFVSAVIAHLAVGDGPVAWGWAVVTGGLWGGSYVLWRRLQGARSGEAVFGTGPREWTPRRETP